MVSRCQKNQAKLDIKIKIKSKYDYLDDEEIETAYDLALSDYLAFKYPSDNNRRKPDEIDIDYFVSNWVYKRMVDIIDRVGGASLTSYRENGMSWTMASGYVDSTLRQQILPHAAVPKSR